MPKFRKRPVVIEARQLTEQNVAEIATWCEGEWYQRHAFGKPQCKVIVIHTLEGDHEAVTGDWIIEGVQGEFYPCKPDIFEETYESYEDEHLEDCQDSQSSAEAQIGIIGGTHVIAFNLDTGLWICKLHGEFAGGSEATCPRCEPPKRPRDFDNEYDCPKCHGLVLVPERSYGIDPQAVCKCKPPRDWRFAGRSEREWIADDFENDCL